MEGSVLPDRIGNAALIWSATSDASGQRVHLLQTPLRAIKAGHSMETFQRQSLDRSVLENVAIGDGSAELRGRVRYDHDPVGLSDAIVAGSQGKTLRYIPDLSDPDVDFQCDLVAPLAPFGLELDQQRGILGDQSVELVLRQTDQGSFDPLYHGSAVLFSYRAGGSLEASSSFGRVTSTSAPASFATLSTDGGGFGSLSTALSNQARIHWMSTASSVGPRTFPTLLLEDSREQLIDESEDLGTWTPINTPVLSSGQSDPYGTTLAWLIEDDNAVSLEGIDKNITLDASAQLVISGFLKQGTTPSANGDRFLAFSSSSTDVIDMRIAWSSGEPTVTFSGEGEAVNPDERWRDSWWRLVGRSSAALSTGTYTIRITPGVVSTDIGDLFAFGIAAEV